MENKMGSVEQHADESDIDIMDIHSRLLMESLPGIVFLIVIGTVGMIGNVISAIFFHREVATPFSVMVARLAALDFFACLMLVISAISIVFNVLFSNTELCKLRATLGALSVASPTVVLTIITIERCRKICQPFKRQLTVTEAKAAVLLVIVIVTIVATKYVFTYDVHETVLVPASNTSVGVVGHACSVSKDSKMKMFIMVSRLFDGAIIFACMACIIVSDVYIIRVLYRQRHRVVTETPSINDEETTNEKTTWTNDECNLNSSSMAIIVEGEEEWLHLNKGLVNDHNRSIRGREKALKQSERIMIKTVIAVSVTFVLGFVPYFIGRLTPDGAIPDELVKIMVKSAYMNNVVNPFLHCGLNAKFRKFLKNACK